MATNKNQGHKMSKFMMGFSDEDADEFEAKVLSGEIKEDNVPLPTIEQVMKKLDAVGQNATVLT